MLNKSLFTAIIRSAGYAGNCCYMPFAEYKPLYNGNISAMSVNIGKLNNSLLYNYQYDQLNRLVAMDAFSGLDTSNNTWHTLTTDNSYQERVSYDANGNIQTYLRNGTTAGGTPLAMDNLTYNYNKDVNGNLTNNKLTSVNDAVAAGNYPNDIDNQSADNYGYDAIGNMTSDAAGGIGNITWTVYGKISSITKDDGSTVSYSYDAAGNCISKTVTPASGVDTTTWYVRDASGNTMAVYTANGSDSLHQTEQDLYGSSRLGIFNRNINADAALPTGTLANLIGSYFTSNFTRGNKFFEGDNHLGNVLITFTDKKFGVDTNGDGIIDYYIADVVNANDYYPFGMLMPGRSYSAANLDYRYGFNGKENDNDIENGMQDYGMRIYDGRLGRFTSADPLTSKYPWFTPYQFSANMPIAAADISGLESILKIYSTGTGTYLNDDDIAMIERRQVKEIKAAMASTILENLDLPAKFKKQNESFIKQIIVSSVSVNFVENRGPIKTVITAIGDVDYEKLFGDKKTEAIEKIGNAFNVANKTADAFSLDVLGPKVTPVLSAIKYGNYAINAANGQFGELGQEVENDLTSTAAKVLAERTAGRFGLSTAASGLVGEYSSNIVGLVLTPLSTNDPGSLSGQHQNATMNNKINKIRSALLFFFMKNNIPSTPSMVPSTSTLQRPISDHPEDKSQTQTTPNLNQK